MSKFIQTNTIKDKLGCPKCMKQFFVLRHKTQDIVCPECGWDGSFDYPDEQGKE